MKLYIRILACRLRGHNWHNHPSGRTTSSIFVTCSRCGTVGWRLLP